MEKIETSVNLRLLIGQLAIIFLILGGLGLSYLNFSNNSYSYAIPILCWTLLFICLGIWTRYNPSIAFLTSLIVYVTSVIIKDIFSGGEYLLPFLFHIYFTISMIVGMNFVQKNIGKHEEQ